MNQTCEHMLHGNLSSTERAWLVGMGAGLFLFGLTRHYPVACILGTLGCALIAEGWANPNIEELTNQASRALPQWGERDMSHPMAHASME